MTGRIHDAGKAAPVPNRPCGLRPTLAAKAARLGLMSRRAASGGLKGIDTKRRRYAVALSALALAAASFAANAAIVFLNLGNAGPPKALGMHAAKPFAIAPQAQEGGGEEEPPPQDA